MKAARKRQTLITTTSKKQEKNVIDCDAQEVTVESRLKMVAGMKIRNKQLFNLRVQTKQEVKPEEFIDQSKSFSCIQLNSASLTERNGILHQTKKSQLVYKQIYVKNPAFTDKRKLAKDQATLDPFLKDFKQSQYLKTSRIISCKYRQLTLLDFKKPQEQQQKVEA